LIYNIEIENLKIVKTQTQPFKTPDVQHFKAALFETETITLLELPSLVPIKNLTDTQDIKVCIDLQKLKLIIY